MRSPGVVFVMQRQVRRMPHKASSVGEKRQVTYRLAEEEKQSYDRFSIKKLKNKLRDALLANMCRKYCFKDDKLYFG